MGKHLINLLNGMRQALVIYPSREYIRPSKDGFHRDSAKLRKDSKAVTRGLRSVALKHGKSADLR